MRSSSPAGSSPSKSPFRSASSKRLVSKVYGRRANVGTTSNKRARLSATPDSDSSLSSVRDDSQHEKEQLEGTVILGELESDSDEDDQRGQARTLEVEDKNSSSREGSRGGALQRKERTIGGKVQVDPGGKKAKRESGIQSSKPSTSRPPIVREDSIPYPKASCSRPTIYKRKTGEISRNDTEINIPSATEIPSLSTFPPITIQPATSSPSILSSSQIPPPRLTPEPPSTPPRKRTKRHGPLTPQSSPRDLSALFAPVSPAKSPGLSRTSSYGANDGGLSKKGAGGLFRKMLDKTQSLGAITSPAKSNQGEEGYFDGFVTSNSPVAGTSIGISRTHSLPATPSKSSPKEPKEESAQPAQSLIVPHASSSRLDATLPTSGGRGKRTYGRSRTILAEVNDSPKSGVSTPGKDKDVIKESYADLRKQFEVDNTDETGTGSLTMDLLAVRGGQSVSDLRSKGENRRFMDELGYLVDPILDSTTSTGLKRSSIYDILRSMQDEEWLQRAKICGQVERIWEAIYAARGSKGDEIIDAMCLLYLVNLVKSGSGLDSILRSRDEECENILMVSLKIKDGPLDEICKMKSTGLLVKIRTMYQQLDMGWSQTTMSTKRLASFLLLEITSPAVRVTSTSSSLLVAEKALSRIAKSLAIDVTDLAGRFDLVEKGLPLLPDDRKTDGDIDHVSQCLTLLSNLVGHSLDDRQALANLHEAIAPAVVDALIIGISLALNSEDTVTSTGTNITIQPLQILAAMSNMSPEWVQAIHQTSGGLTSLARVLLHRSALISTSSSAKSAASQHDQVPIIMDTDEVAEFFSPKKPTSSQAQNEIGAEDVLCLVLVILTALILGSTETTSALASLRIDTSCTGSKACLRTCKCPNSALLAAHLVNTYVEHKNSKEDASSLIAAYIALILSKLILARPDLLNLLPGSDADTKAHGLIEVLSDLKGLQSFLHTRLRVAAGGQEEDGQVGGEGGAMEGDDGVVEGAMEDLRRLAEKLGS